MSILSPSARQLIVALTPQLAALSIGGLTGFPVVLLDQLKDESSIKLDLASSSWIASIHGFVGILSLIMSSLMQWKGRKCAFTSCCIIIIFGWIIIFYSKTITCLLIGESLHGIGGNSLLVISLTAISEMVEPKYRSMCLIVLCVIENLGLVFSTLSGYFLYWRSVCIVMTVPLVLAVILVSFWPESPPWLACKGEFIKCEEAFILLRGTGRKATKELNEMIQSQKESFREMSLKTNNSKMKEFFAVILRRDFYLPNFHVIVILFTLYMSGPLVIFTYAVEIIKLVTDTSNYQSFLYIDGVIVVGVILAVILIQYLKNKSMLIFSFIGGMLFLLIGALVSFTKNFNIFPSYTMLLCILGFILCCTSGSAHVAFSLSTEVIPVKHRGIIGCLYIIYTCLFHSISLKVSPYLFHTINVYGTFLIFGLISLLGSFYIWKYVPETKNKTLQEIENSYNKCEFSIDNIGDVNDDNV